MLKSSLQKWTPLLSLIIGALIGPGFFWQWRQSGIEIKKQELDEAEKTTDLRAREDDIYAKIIELSNEYIQDTDQYSKAPSDELRIKIVQQNSRLEAMKDDFTTLEAKLAHLEGRTPRTIPLSFLPPKPPTLAIKAQ